MTRPVFTLHVRAGTGVDAIKALRGWLKSGLRNFGLRCLAVYEDANPNSRRSNMAISINERYGSTFLTAQDVETGELILRIAYLELDADVKGKIKDLLHFADDDRSLVLNPTNARQIARLHGDNPDNWRGKWITLHYDPDVMYQDQKVGGIRVRNTVPATPAGSNGPLPEPPPQREQPKRRDDFDDSIPF
jgi:hypothetical protein